MQPEIIFYIIVLIFSIVLHEAAHGYTAYMFKDNTAYFSGRLTLNPLKHLDLFGSVIFPIFLVLSHSPLLFGWAKPVPVSEHSLQPFKLGKFCVAISGIVTNLSLAITFIALSHFFESSYTKKLFYIIAITNTSLGIFNLMPFPPSVGYKILETFLPWQLKRKIDSMLSQNFLVFQIIVIFAAVTIFSKLFPYINVLIYSQIF